MVSKYEMLWKNKLHFDQEEMLKWLEALGLQVFGCADSNGMYMYRLYIQMFLSYGLYICNILETTHHRTTFGIFCNITQNTTHKENSQKMFHTSSLIVIFLMGRSRTFLEIRIKFHLGRTKGRGNMGRETQNEVFFAKFPLLSKIQTLSHKLLVRQTSNYHHCNWHAKEPICRDFQVILISSFRSKITLCIFKEQIWLSDMKCYGMLKMA